MQAWQCGALSNLRSGRPGSRGALNSDNPRDAENRSVSIPKRYRPEGFAEGHRDGPRLPVSALKMRWRPCCPQADVGS